mmetsp:Transcript_24959/g.55332  ORF Transcript_24959/g.55332 Transcript_24959/m.55332 type:complete len:323 (+) Transcript_24959:971-1939(+)
MCLLRLSALLLMLQSALLRPRTNVPVAPLLLLLPLLHHGKVLELPSYPLGIGPGEARHGAKLPPSRCSCRRCTSAAACGAEGIVPSHPRSDSLARVAPHGCRGVDQGASRAGPFSSSCCCCPCYCHRCCRISTTITRSGKRGRSSSGSDGSGWGEMEVPTQGPPGTRRGEGRGRRYDDRCRRRGDGSEGRFDVNVHVIPSSSASAASASAAGNHLPTLLFVFFALALAAFHLRILFIVLVLCWRGGWHHRSGDLSSTTAIVRPTTATCNTGRRSGSAANGRVDGNISGGDGMAAHFAWYHDVIVVLFLRCCCYCCCCYYYQR